MANSDYTSKRPIEFKKLLQVRVWTPCLEHWIFASHLRSSHLGTGSMPAATFCLPRASSYAAMLKTLANPWTDEENFYCHLGHMGVTYAAQNKLS